MNTRPLLGTLMALALCAAEPMAAQAAGQPSGLPLRESVEATLRTHRQLKSLQENRQAALHDVRRAESGYKPRLDITARGGTGYLNDATTRSQYSARGMHANGNAGLVLSQPIWDGRATSNRVEMAEYQVKSMDYRVIDNATTLSLDAIIAHADVLLRRELLTYAHENVGKHEEILAAQRERISVGALTVADVTQIEGRLVRARAQLVEAQANLSESEDNYRRVTGQSVPPELGSVPMPKVTYASSENCYDAATRHNPKLQAFLEDSRQAASRRKLATSAYSPTLNAEAGTGYNDRDGRGSNWSKYADASLVMRWNLYNGDADRASEQVAAAQYRQSREDAFNLGDTLRLEVANAWTRLRSATEQEGYYERAMTLNRETRAGFMEQFLIGQRSLLDVLDLSSELFNSQNQWAINRTNRHIAAYTLSALAGQVLEQFNINPASLLPAKFND